VTEAAPAAVDAAEDPKKAAIAAAMARAKAQREAAQPKNTEAVTIEQEREIAAIDARREAASVGNTPTQAATETKTD
jgi:electron transport complex protein RnfC